MPHPIGPGNRKPPTPAQMALLRQVLEVGVLAYGGEGHWFFHGARYKVNGGTASSLLTREWIKGIPRREDQPFWLTEYELTDTGRAAIGATGA